MIIAAWAERTEGPGWANTPIWYLTQSAAGLALHCIQPEQQTDEMRTLYCISNAAHLSMTRAVQRWMEKRVTKKYLHKTKQLSILVAKEEKMVYVNVQLEDEDKERKDNLAQLYTWKELVRLGLDVAESRIQKKRKDKCK